MGDVPQQPSHASLVVNNTDNDSIAGSDDNDEGTESNNNDRSDDDNDDDLSGNNGNNEPDDLVAATNVGDNKSGNNQGVQRLQRRGKSITKKYANYSLLMAARQTKRGGPRRALICNRCIFFSADDLSIAKPISKEDREEFALGVALVHYLMNAGIRKFKAKGEAGVTKEFTQMHDMSVFCPIEVEALTYNKRKKALSLLLFLKEKRDSLVKASMCADGCKQKDGTWSKQNTTLPTVAMKLVFITAIVNTYKEHNVACFDIPGASSHANIKEDITMVLKGRLVELMVQVTPNLCRKYITVDREGTAILYVKMQKALYGLLRSALLFYRKLVANQESDGFVLNPYDLYVANKVVNGKQMTVCWHVDNLKVSHCNPNQVTIFGEWLRKKYGMAVATHQGKVHDYLSMIFDFSAKGKVMVTMVEYIKNIIRDFPEEITGIKTSPAADHLFTVRDPSLAKALPEKQAMAFHCVTAQLLFLSARVWRDIQPITAFLTTQVRLPDKDNWGKVKRVLSYLKGTLHMPLILLADSLTLLQWWVDVAYAVHDNCRGHTGRGGFDKN